MKRLSAYIAWIYVLLAVVTGCRQGNVNPQQLPESKEAKQLLQGVWTDEETEDVVFKIQGDTVFYVDSTSMPAYFKVVGDTLYIGDAVGYFIEKQTDHVIWFKNQAGERVKLVKNDERDDEEVFEKGKAEILSLSGVLKRDTVVMYDNKRYHLYIVVNPTRNKVVRHTLNEDGLDVENVFYDNVIHVSVFQGANKLFSKDFRKQQYQQRVPASFLEQSILNNIEYDKTDAQGFHFNASVCAPGDASCYLIEHVISFDGMLSTQLLEY